MAQVGRHCLARAKLSKIPVVMYTVLSSLATCGRLGAATVAAAGVLFWHAASWHATSIARVARRRDASRLVSRASVVVGDRRV